MTIQERHEAEREYIDKQYEKFKEKVKKYAPTIYDEFIEGVNNTEDTTG